MEKRPVRIANCSGAHADPGFQMRRQIELGPIDFVTGDYLAEMNIAENAAAYRSGKHPGYEATALDGLVTSLDLIAAKGVKVIINGGALNPSGLARKCIQEIKDRHLDLRVAYVSGDDIYPIILEDVQSLGKRSLTHLDSVNPKVQLHPLTESFVEDIRNRNVVAANAYLGARAIVKGLEANADIIICGRVSDASPVIAAAWYWHSWKSTDYDMLASALIAGHLIECSAYVTGANYAAFDEVEQSSLIDIGFPIVEVDSTGTCILTKHSNTNGLVTEDTVKCQFLYELQGLAYLNSDVTAILDGVKIENCGLDRVRVSGIRGQPPPPTTKLAVFYEGGYRSEFLLNATGYATNAKWALYEDQIRFGLKERGLQDHFDILEFQCIGTPEPDAPSQLRCTTYCRVIAMAAKSETLLGLYKVIREFGMQHFSGAHRSLDLRTALPRPFIAYFPAVIPQDRIKEEIVILDSNGAIIRRENADYPPRYEEVPKRVSYDPPPATNMTSLGDITRVPLGDMVLARSGDKGPNINIGLFVRDELTWGWFQSFMTISKMQELIGDDWSEDFFIERVEFQNIFAVHFVIYGILGRGVTSTARLDCLGKGFADFIRWRHIDVPTKILEAAQRKILAN